MRSKKLFIVRHGQTDYNLNGIVQGSGINSDINETGQYQRDAFFNAYKHVPFDRIYTSGLKRTHQSVEPFLNNGTRHQVLDGLNEINWGTKEGTAFAEDGAEYYADMINRWNSGQTDYRVDGGESPRDVQERINKAMDVIVSQDGEQILVCTHGRALRILMCTILNYPLHLMDEFEHSNLGLYVINYHEGRYFIEVTNDTSHLNGVA